ncbi:hypothetical protein AMURIS_05166 [Acetatifactor muris]|uniref:Uncharacterized protein n=1 Tax=Acetatifactor muris TaxID=879566 RepID=A0A2K4ZPL0_9FIRM|nr:hypothetical protein AMURIS_05166 [Acetatifactor muris]
MLLLVVNLFSSSAATGLVLDIFRTSRPDSYAGMLTSILMSCTETVFYTMSVYFLAAKVTKPHFIIMAGLPGLVQQHIIFADEKDYLLAVMLSEQVRQSAKAVGKHVV